MPDLLQSVTKQVSALSWKDLTPEDTNFTISIFAFSKASCRSLSQAKTEFFPKSFLKGSIRAVFENENATCSISPNQDLIPVMSVGLGKFVIDSSV